MPDIPDSAVAMPMVIRHTQKRGRVRVAFKRMLYGIALLIVLPLAGAELIARRITGRDVWFSMHGEMLSILPGKTGWILRNAYLHLTLRRCPLDCCFLFGVLFTHSEAEVGERVYIGARSIVGMAKIGDDTMLSDQVQVLSGSYQHGTATGARFQDQDQIFKVVNVGRNVWIGANAVVMADVGDNTIIGAGSVVTRPIPADSVAVGAPARVIRAAQHDVQASVAG
jgi:acetyltransferase-like isoleucine patch superfamily enzyme